jgi:Aldo/keto reductase family
MQDQYSLIQREEEREMLGLFAAQGVGSIPWSSLAKGRLARPWGEPATRRSGNDPIADRFFRDRDKPSAEAVQQVAQNRGIRIAQVALAWVLKNPVVAAPIVGPTKPDHLADARLVRWTSTSPTTRSARWRSSTPRACPPASDALWVRAQPGAPTPHERRPTAGRSQRNASALHEPADAHRGLTGK